MKAARILVSMLMLILFSKCYGQYIFKDLVKIPATKVKNQQWTGTCWCFSTTSFLESEIIRMSGRSLDLSEMYTVRMCYIDKAQNYILRQSYTRFDQGGLFHDVLAVIDNYGIIPQESFPGFGKGDDSLNHFELAEGLKAYLNAIIKVGTPGKHWNEAINGMLDAYMGSVPQTFNFENNSYNPKSFKESLKIETNQFITITSFTHHPFYTNFILEIPDNYRNGVFFNVKLEDLIIIADNALNNGYTFVWDGDFSEKCISVKQGLIILPKEQKSDSVFSKPVKEIEVTQDNRQSNFMNFSTTEDHLMHIVGRAKDQNNTEYYIVKNSYGEVGPYKGYLYMSKAFFKMKTVSISLHKNALPTDILKKL